MDYTVDDYIGFWGVYGCTVNIRYEKEYYIIVYPNILGAAPADCSGHSLLQCCKKIHPQVLEEFNKVKFNIQE